MKGKTNELNEVAFLNNQRKALPKNINEFKTG